LRKSTVILRKGDLSAPVLAIIVTIGLIAAGLVLLAWFFWFAPQASKTGALQIIGQPAVVCNGTYNSWVVISLKNTGSNELTVSQVLVGNLTYTITGGTLLPGASNEFTPKGRACPATWKYTVDGAVVTSAGTYLTSFTVIRT
jgi:hypothetical protein